LERRGATVKRALVAYVRGWERSYRERRDALGMSANAL